MIQTVLRFPARGGKRPGAGRAPKGGRAGMPHRARPALASRHPVHITRRVHEEVWSLRSRRWEQERGVRIESLENPGWLLEVDLAGTGLEQGAADGVLHFDGEPPRDVSGEVVLVGKAGQVFGPAGNRWLICGIHQQRFHAAGDSGRLRDLIRAFREWASKPG